MKYATLEDRLIANTTLDPEGSECWLWLGKIDRRSNTFGYPKLNVWCPTLKKIVTKRAHRVAFDIFRGAIPDGYEIDHTCRNPSCINPAHLDAVPAATNLGRRVWGGVKHAAE